MGEHAKSEPLGPEHVIPTVTAQCQDCGAPISGNYCSNCGQETRIETPTVRQFVHELMDQYVAVEGKLGRTLRVLLTRPGQLTLDYVEGRRQRYVRPLKLYVSVSVVFFGLLGLLPDSIGNPFTKVDQAETREQPPPPPPPVAKTGQDKGVAPAGAAAGAVADSDAAAQIAKPEGAGVPPAEDLDLREQIQRDIEKDLAKGKAEDIGDTVNRQVAAELKKSHAERKKGFSERLSSPQKRKELRAKLADDAPYAMFFLLPYFALLLRWLYRKNKQRYGVHLLFTVHLHCFAFILLMLMFLPFSPLRTALELVGVAYTFLALRRVYGGGWARTLWRMAILGFLDFVAISATALSGVLTTVFGGSP
ncbi:DUF3667 domain-containing protein [Nevskia soli]|uniref:DUF3667 domain-containing protein n=1 Tax=Nevskia soli TaxID=418856 RepID=UPI000559D0BE|nr:DUF3667 domain-containing protein [Nevskia soli]